jgi:hypothetical protein
LRSVSIAALGRSLNDVQTVAPRKSERAAGDIRLTDQLQETLVGGHDGTVLGDDQPLDGSIGKAAHAVVLGCGTTAVAQVEIAAAQRKQQDHHRDHGDDERQPLRRLVGG